MVRNGSLKIRAIPTRVPGYCPRIANEVLHYGSTVLSKQRFTPSFQGVRRYPQEVCGLTLGERLIVALPLRFVGATLLIVEIHIVFVVRDRVPIDRVSYSEL